MDINKKAMEAHKKLKGKIEILPKAKIRNFADLSLYYTPGVGAVASYLAKNKKETRNWTIKNNMVAVVSDGSAVLGLGNIGPEGAMPVMEGKAMIFKAFAGIDAFPIVLDTQNTDEIVKTVKNIAPVFGGINLEDIAAPRCFVVEKRLKEILDIPVMHDDQHGTAIVVLAGLINAFKVARKDLYKAKIVIVGAGAAGNAIVKLLYKYGARNILVLDSKGIIYRKRKDLDEYKKELAKITNENNFSGSIADALIGADAVIGVSAAGVIKSEYVLKMNKKAIVFAMANPNPEIMPVEAKKAGVFIIATGRSDFPNQINNALVFPGIFRGALDNEIKAITDEMKLKVALRLAGLIKNPNSEKIIPAIFDKRVVGAVAEAVMNL